MSCTITTTPITSLTTLATPLSPSPHLLRLTPLFSSLSLSPTLTITGPTTITSPPLPILNFEGDQVGTTQLTLKTAPPSTARAVVHRAIITDLQNKRRGTASTLTRGEVRGGGRKPYKQKKTGNARRGSQRTPLRPGGGVIFGPKPRDWSIKINKKEKRLAISTAIASAVGEGEGDVVVVEEFGERYGVPKTREFVEMMSRWGIDPKRKATFLMKELEENVQKSGRNVGTVKLLTPRTLNLYDVLNADKLVLTRWAVEYLNQTYGVDSEFDEEEEGEDDDEEGDEGEEEEGSDEGDNAEVVE
ncbi:Large ribosomal subunit protein uL4c-like protein [Drosera capensis]